MKRFLAVLLWLVALVVLGSVFLRQLDSDAELASSVTTSGPPSLATGSPELTLELSRSLQQLPAASVATDRVSLKSMRDLAQPYARIDSRRSRYLLLLGAAALIGLMLGVSAQHKTRQAPAIAPAPAHNRPTDEALTLRAELEERDDAITALERQLESRVSAAANTLSEPLQDKIAQQDTAITDLNEDVAARDARIATQIAELEEKSTRLSALESELAMLSERDQPLERQLAEQARDRDELEQALSTRRSEIVALQEELATAVERRDLLIEANDELTSEVRTLSELLENHEVDTGRLEQKAQEDSAELASWKDSVASLEQEIEQRATIIEDLESELSSRSQEIERIRIERTGLSDTISMLQKRLDEVNEQHAADHVALINQIAELEGELEHRVNQLGLIDEQRAERDGMMVDLQREIETYQHQIMELEGRLDEMQQQEKRMGEWESTLSTYKSDLANRGQIIDSLRDETARLADTEQQVLDQQETIAELEGELRQLADERAAQISELGVRLQEAQDESVGLREQIQLLEQAMAGRDVDLDKSQQEVNAAREEMHELEQELADWRVKFTSLEEQLREREASLEYLRSQYAEGEDRLAGLDKLREQLQQTHAERDAALERVQIADEACDKLREEIAKFAALEQKFAAWESTVTTLRSDLHERDATLFSLLDELGKLVDSQVSTQGWPAALNDVRLRLEEQDRQIETLRSEITELEPVKKQSLELEQTLRHQLDERNADISAMRHELERNQGALARAEKAQIELDKRSQQTDRLAADTRSSKERIKELELYAADWIDKHAALNSRYESQTAALRQLELEMQQLRDKFDAQRQTILHMREDKMQNDGVDELPTLSKVVRSGKGAEE